jgi:hypothetical protein
MNITKINTFWSDDIGVLFKANRLLDIIPLKNMTTEEKLNAILRLSIYFSLIHYILKRNSNILFIPIAVSIITYILYTNNFENTKLSDTIEKLSGFVQMNGVNKPRANNLVFESTNEYEDKYKDINDSDNLERINDVYQDDDCKLPTIDNPFGNVLLSDINNPNFKETCTSYNNNMVKRDIKSNFEDNLFMDVNDVYSKHNSQRQFYTMPVTDVCNDQEGFAKWCYLTPPTCKEGNGAQCTANLSNPNGLNVSHLLSSQVNGNNPA